MTLHKIRDFYPDYKTHFGDRDVKGLDLYAGSDKIGSVDDVLVDDEGQFRYLIINTGGWIIGKKVLMPIGRARIDNTAKRVYADSLTKAQVEALPEFNDDMTVDYEHEEQVRGVYRGAPTAQGVGYAGAATAPTTTNTPPMVGLEQGYAGYDRDSYAYAKEPDLYAIDDKNHPDLKLYEERLVAGKTRQKTGEAVISKRIETEIAKASVPIEKERVVIERVPVNSQTAVTPSEANFKEGEVSRMDIYEEVPEFHKEAFVREEIRVSKVVDKDTATAQETLRREEIDVDNQGNPIVDKKI